MATVIANWMKYLQDGTRVVLDGVEHVIYRGRALRPVIGGSMTVEELEARQTEIRDRLSEIDQQYAGEALPSEARTEWNTLNKERESNGELIEELRARRDRVEELAGQRGANEPGAGFHTPRPGVARGNDIWDLTEVREAVNNPGEANRELYDRAQRAIEGARFPHEDAKREEVQTHLLRQLETIETDRGDLARHILVTGSPSYQRGFSKALMGRPLDASEARALSIGTGVSGGFAIPFQLDPTIIPTSNGSVNPYRQIAREESIVGTDTWKGVSSAGVTASYGPEAAEAGDNAPELAQPEVKAERAQAFVPYSIEAGQDWGGLQAEMAKLFQDAKDDLEAEKFTLGDGDDEPFGLITGATIGVETATANVFAINDLYTVEEALGARFRARAQWLGARPTYNDIRQLTGEEDGEDVWVRLSKALINSPVGNTGAELLGYSANEVSAMASGTVTGVISLVLGDFRYFVVVDRIGMTVEIIPHLMGPNRRPTGQRGLYAIWRNGSKVLAANAFRHLKVKAPA